METVVEEGEVIDRGEAMRRGFRMGDWIVRPVEGMLDGATGQHHLQPKSMDVLLCLARSASDIVERDALIAEVWGQTAVSDEPLTRCIHEIRRELGDTCGQPTYIQTIPKRGYRLIASVEVLDSDPEPGGERASLGRLIFQSLRCRVAQVGVVYAAVAWLLIQLAVSMQAGSAPAAGSSSWLLPALIIALTAGFPVAIFIAWMSEVRDAGMRMGKPRASVPRLLTTRRGVNVIVMAALFAIMAGMSLRLRPADPLPPVASIHAPSVAVLPFATEGEVSRAEWLGDGLAEDLLNLLAEVDGIEVVSRTASFRDFPPTTDVVEIGHELNVHYILKGSVERSDDRLRVSARLIDAQTRHRLWSQRFERSRDEWFALQESIVNQVAAAVLPSGGAEIWPALPAVDTLHVAVAPTSNIEAYEYHLKARRLLRAADSHQALDAAAENFAQAIKLDAGFAMAYAGLCQTFVRQVQLRPSPEFTEAATEVCRRGVTLHPDSTDTRLAWADMTRVGGKPRQAITEYRQVTDRKPNAVAAYIGMAAAYADIGNVAAAERFFRRAIDIRPNHDPAYRAFGGFLFANGRYGEALEVGRRMIQLDPDSPAGYTTLGDASFYSGHFTAAIAAYREVINRDANAYAYSRLGASLYYLGRYHDAINLYRQAAELAPRDHLVWAGIGDVYTQLAGEVPQAEDAYRIAREHVEEDLALSPNDAINRVRLAYYCAAIGDKACAWRHSGDAIAQAPEQAAVHYLDALVNLRFDREAAAIAAVERTLQLGYPRALLAADPQLEAIRNNPRLSGLFLARQTLAQLAP